MRRFRSTSEKADVVKQNVMLTQEKADLARQVETLTIENATVVQQKDAQIQEYAQDCGVLAEAFLDVSQQNDELKRQLGTLARDHADILWQRTVMWRRNGRLGKRISDVLQRNVKLSKRVSNVVRRNVRLTAGRAQLAVDLQAVQARVQLLESNLGRMTRDRDTKSRACQVFSFLVHRLHIEATQRDTRIFTLETALQSEVGSHNVSRDRLRELADVLDPLELEPSTLEAAQALKKDVGVSYDLARKSRLELDEHRKRSQCYFGIVTSLLAEPSTSEGWTMQHLEQSWSSHSADMMEALGPGSIVSGISNYQEIHGLTSKVPLQRSPWEEIALLCERLHTPSYHATVGHIEAIGDALRSSNVSCIRTAVVLLYAFSRIRLGLLSRADRYQSPGASLVLLRSMEIMVSHVVSLEALILLQTLLEQLEPQLQTNRPLTRVVLESVRQRISGTSAEPCRLSIIHKAVSQDFAETPDLSMTMLGTSLFVYQKHTSDMVLLRPGQFTMDISIDGFFLSCEEAPLLGTSRLASWPVTQAGRLLLNLDLNVDQPTNAELVDIDSQLLDELAPLINASSGA